MGIPNARFRDGDVYIAYEYENVLFRYDHASKKSFRRFAGENQEYVVPHDNRLFNEAIRFGHEIDPDSYTGSSQKTARFAKAGYDKSGLSTSYTVLRVATQHSEAVPPAPETMPISEGTRYLHTVGFMDNTRSVIQVMLQGTLVSNTGLIFLRPASFARYLEGPQYADDTVWVELDRKPRLLAVENQSQLMNLLGIVQSNAHTDNPTIARQVAEGLRENGYDGYLRKDFPEIAVLSDIPNRVVGRLEGDFYMRDEQGNIIRTPQ